jgi:hypothetical protein
VLRALSAYESRLQLRRPQCSLGGTATAWEVALKRQTSRSQGGRDWRVRHHCCPEYINAIAGGCFTSAGMYICNKSENIRLPRSRHILDSSQTMRPNPLVRCETISLCVLEKKAHGVLTIRLGQDVVYRLLHYNCVSWRTVAQASMVVPLWMASASLSGISMLNSWRVCQIPVPSNGT